MYLPSSTLSVKSESGIQNKLSHQTCYCYTVSIFQTLDVWSYYILLNSLTVLVYVPEYLRPAKLQGGGGCRDVPAPRHFKIY